MLSQSNSDKLKMQKPVLLLLVLLLSQVLAKATPKTKIANLISRTSYNRASSVNTDLSSPSACTTTEIDDGSGTMSEVENVLYGISSALVPVVAEVASEVALEEYAVAVSAAYNLWVRNNMIEFQMTNKQHSNICRVFLGDKMMMILMRKMNI